MNEGLSRKARKRAWQAVCHDLIGAATSVENQLDATLAAAHAGSVASLRRLQESVFPRLGADVKRGLLSEVLDMTTPTAGVPAVAYLPWCVPGLEHLMAMRNVMAHHVVTDESTDEVLVLGGYRRGRPQTREYTLAQVNYARDDLARALGEDLRTLARWNTPSSWWVSRALADL